MKEATLEAGGSGSAERREYYRLLFEHNPDAILLTVPDGSVKAANPAACELFGMTEKQIRRAGRQGLTDNNHPNYLSALETWARTGRFAGELAFFRKGGLRFTAEVSSVEVEEGRMAFVILRDISDRKRLEEEHRLSEHYELQRVLLSTIPAFVYLKDSNSVYVEANREFSKLLGMPEDEIRGKTDYELFPKAVADSFRKMDAEVMTTGKAGLHYEDCTKDAQGRDVWFLTSKYPFYGPSGEAAGVIGISIDITDKVLMRQDLVSANEAMEKRIEKYSAELVEKMKQLDEANVALNVLLRRLEQEKVNVRESMTHNVRELILPCLDQLEHGAYSSQQDKARLDEVRRHLEAIASDGPKRLSFLGLSPSELRVAEMIRADKSNKEIAQFLSVSDATVRTHRDRIRVKLGLRNQKTNLRVYLQSLK